MKFLKIFAFLGIIITCVSCQTTDKNKTSTSKSMAAKRPISAVAAEFTVPLQMAQETSDQIYLKMLAIELSAGIKVKKDYLHSSKGTMQCHRDGIIESCFFRVRVIGDELSSTQPVSRELSDKIWSYIRDLRGDLREEKVVLTDLVCDSIGKKSPPYDQESVACKMQYPRATNEAIFVDTTAEELAESLRGGAHITNAKVVLNGVIACQWDESNSQTPCVAKFMEEGELSEKALELPLKTSQPLAKRMVQTLQDYYAMKKGHRTFVIPSEITGSVECTIDSLGFETSNSRRYSCRVRI